MRDAGVDVEVPAVQVAGGVSGAIGWIRRYGVEGAADSSVNVVIESGSAWLAQLLYPYHPSTQQRLKSITIAPTSPCTRVRGERFDQGSRRFFYSGSESAAQCRG